MVNYLKQCGFEEVGEVQMVGEKIATVVILRRERFWEVLATRL
jgi:hypothetical protein